MTFADGPDVEADGATPILDAAEGAGVLMPSGCRMGICMGCVIPLKSRAPCATCATARSPSPCPVRPAPAAYRSRPASALLLAPATSTMKELAHR